MSTKDTASTLVALFYLVVGVAVIGAFAVAFHAQGELDARISADSQHSASDAAWHADLAALRAETARQNREIRSAIAATNAEIRAVRASLDHITIRVHVPSCCAP